jgi:hypothetical protein
MSLDPDEIYFWRKVMMNKCRPVFDAPMLSYAAREKIEMLTPDRTVGVIAAYEYLSNRMIIHASIVIPVILLVVLAIGIAVVAWAIR